MASSGGRLAGGLALGAGRLRLGGLGLFLGRGRSGSGRSSGSSGGGTRRLLCLLALPALFLVAALAFLFLALLALGFLDAAAFLVELRALEDARALGELVGGQLVERLVALLLRRSARGPA